MLKFLITALIMAGCSGQAISPADIQRKDITMTSLSTLNDFFSTYHADAGSSVSLGDGRVLWLFGDTFRGATMDRNSAVIQQGDTFTPIDGTFASPTTPDHWYWPGEAIREGTLLRVLMQDFVSTGSGPFDFAYQQTDVLTYSLPDLHLMQTVSLPARTSGAAWGPLRRAANGYIYAYGAYPVEGTLGKAYEAARVPNGLLAIPSAWQYLGTKMTASMELGAAVSVIKTATGYRLYSKRLDLWSEEIISFDAKTPTGPWTNRQVVLRTPQPAGMWTYSVIAHPEQGSGVLTYATNCETLCPEYHLTAVAQ
jgi:hypothetical protein